LAYSVAVSSPVLKYLLSIVMLSINFFFSNKINKNKYIPLKRIPTPSSAGGEGGEGQKDTCELDGPFSRDLKENNSH